MINGKYNSLRSFSSDRSYTLNRSSYARDSMMIEELLVPAKDQVRACVSATRYLCFLFTGDDSLQNSAVLAEIIATLLTIEQGEERS